MAYIIRDHDMDKFKARKALLEEIVAKKNAEFGQNRVTLDMEDSYYNMGEIIRKDMSIISLVEEAMKNIDIEPVIEPVRGGTDGSKISYLGIPTPNIFAGGENMHGRFEFVAVESMEKATSLIVEIARLNATK